jgi:hypothetical protein
LREKKVQNPGTAVIDIVTNVAPQEKQPKTSFTGTDSTTYLTCKRYSIFFLFYCKFLLIYKNVELHIWSFIIECEILLARINS